MTAGATRLAAALAGRYRFDHELGTGGMATVYLADDLRHGRTVAIKVLSPELAIRWAAIGSSAKSSSPRSSRIRTSCRCTTRAKPTASSIT